MKAHDGMYIGGEWRPAAGTDTIAVVDPADEQVIAHVPAGTAEDVDAAVSAARGAFRAWAATPPAERAARIAALRDVLAARKDEIAATVTAELGAPLPFSQAVHAGVPILVAARTPSLPRRTPSRSRSATPPSTPNRSASSARSPRGTTRCTRSSPRSPPRSRPAARWSSSLPRTPR